MHAHTLLVCLTVSATNSHGVFRRTMQSKDNVQTSCDVTIDIRPYASREVEIAAVVFQRLL